VIGCRATKRESRAEGLGNGEPELLGRIPQGSCGKRCSFSASPSANPQAQERGSCCGYVTSHDCGDGHLVRSRGGVRRCARQRRLGWRCSGALGTSGGTGSPAPAAPLTRPVPQGHRAQPARPARRPSADVKPGADLAAEGRDPSAVYAGRSLSSRPRARSLCTARANNPGAGAVAGGTRRLLPRATS